MELRGVPREREHQGEDQEDRQFAHVSSSGFGVAIMDAGAL